MPIGNISLTLTRSETTPVYLLLLEIYDLFSLNVKVYNSARIFHTYARMPKAQKVYVLGGHPLAGDQDNSPLLFPQNSIVSFQT